MKVYSVRAILEGVLWDVQLRIRDDMVENAYNVLKSKVEMIERLRSKDYVLLSFK